MDKISIQQRSRNMANIKGRDTAPEKKVRSLLHKLGYRFRLHRKDLSGSPDLVFPGRQSVIFVHGCFWHGHNCSRAKLPSSNQLFWETKINKNKERDIRVESQLLQEGWRVLTLWQCQMKDLGALQGGLINFLENTAVQDTL